ncbi:hypothetical protein [Leptospira sp. GIMC2001]|uniref:hypothetical protein n=1 Tax=Leptospira sp. GIMC2001 TaxID=1513297 RepID=UPI00234BDDAB|nr:hypothetical protein [Leptospira sp. GIMC2001]WCL49741.1 hypothetical protein O4O04_02665 [Leptospira sp. GIMC2001]
MRNFRILSIVIVLSLILSGINRLESAEVIEVSKSVEDANIQIIAVLSKIDPDGYYSDPKTGGFIHKYTDKAFSPFYYKIYIGRMSQNSVDSIIRIESSKRGSEKMWKQILEAELLKNPENPEARKIDKKNYFYSHGLNLIQPSLSVIYNSYNSPIYTNRDTFWSSLIYIAVDLVLVGGAYAYASGKAPRKSLWDNLLNRSGPPELHRGPDAGAIFGALAVTRLYRMIGSQQDTASHNKVAEFSYTFSF